MVEFTEEQKYEALFMNLVMSLGQATMVAMGKITNPMTGKTESRLDEAQYNIELLAALQRKTKGNLGRQEQAMLDTTLMNIRLTYVAEMKRQAETKDEAGKDKAEAPVGTEPVIGTEEPAEEPEETGTGPEEDMKED